MRAAISSDSSAPRRIRNTSYVVRSSCSTRPRVVLPMLWPRKKRDAKPILMRPFAPAQRGTCGAVRKLEPGGRGFVQSADVLLDLGEILEHPDVGAIRLQRLPVKGDGLVVPLRQLKNRAEVVQRIRVMGIGGDRGSELLFGGVL